MNNLNFSLEQAKTILRDQRIDETHPGTILKDFKTFLAFVKNEGIEVSGKNCLFPLKVLEQLNAQLTNPTQIDLKRPVQKSYPYLNGIYLLLRTTGLAEVHTEKKQQRLVLNEATYESWHQLNLTEQYFTLLEAWLIHASSETIGERDRIANLIPCLDFWQMLKQDALNSAQELQGNFSFAYTPKLYNLALLDLFGLLNIEQGKPEKGKGWRIAGLQKTPYGNALLSLLMFSLLEQGSEAYFNDLLNVLQQEPTIRFGKLQNALQPYFPEWQNNLVLEQDYFVEGVYVFKVSLGKPWRKIAVPSFLCLDALAEAILDAFEFCNDHLYQFICKQSTGKILTVNHPVLEDKPFTHEFLVGDLSLKPTQTMTFLFDFGFEWKFNLVLEAVQSPENDLKQPKLLKSYGTAPEQYPF